MGGMGKIHLCVLERARQRCLVLEVQQPPLCPPVSPTGPQTPRHVPPRGGQRARLRPGCPGLFQHPPRGGLDLAGASAEFGLPGNKIIPHARALSCVVTRVSRAGRGAAAPAGSLGPGGALTHPWSSPRAHGSALCPCGDRDTRPPAGRRGFSVGRFHTGG